MWILQTFRMLPHLSSVILLYWDSSGVILPEKQLPASDMRDFLTLQSHRKRSVEHCCAERFTTTPKLLTVASKRNVPAKAVHLLGQIAAITGGPINAPNRSADYWKAEKGS
jgi:hypothetical protein